MTYKHWINPVLLFPPDAALPLPNHPGFVLVPHSNSSIFSRPGFLRYSIDKEKDQ
jgi:hypothetical protein